MKKRLISIITAIAVICSILMIMPVMNAYAANYQPSLAIDYARKHWNNYNPAYKNYNSSGGDCANFVSQCMYAGGLPQDGTWKKDSVAWIQCAAQVQYFKDKGYNVKDYATAADIKPGNPVYYYNGGRLAHAAICVGYDSNGTPLVAAHNNNHWNYEWTLGGTKWWGGSSRRVTVFLSEKNNQINTPVDTSYQTPAYNIKPKATSGLITVYNVYGVPYDTSVRNIAPGDNCIIHEVYKTGFCKVEYPTPRGNHTEYARTSDFNFINTPIDSRFASYLPFRIYLCNNATAYVATGEIWESDECTITAVYTNGTCDVTYPVGNNKTKSVNTSLSHFIPNTACDFVHVKADKQINTYSRPDGQRNIGYVSAGDGCVKIASSGSKILTMYPTSLGWKCGWLEGSLLSHSHSYGAWQTSKAANCTAAGSQVRKCACGATESRSVSALGHSFGNWTTKSATCTVDGNKTRSCSRCGHKETQTIAKTGHKYTSKVVAPTCTAKGYTQYTCSVCKNTYKDKYTNMTSHKFGDWTVVKNATCTADGSKTRKCSCGKQKLRPSQKQVISIHQELYRQPVQLRAIKNMYVLFAKTHTRIPILI